MNHHESIILAEQHRADLLADAASVRTPRHAERRNRLRRSWFLRRRGS